MDKVSLKDCQSIDQLSTLFGMDYKTLSSIIYSNKSLYVSFQVPKKNGSVRTISAPKPKLKAIQKVLANELKNYYLPRINTHGFICGKSILTNAEQHINKTYVFNLDFKDFFSSIHFGRVRNLFKSDPFAFPDKVATVLAHICCYKGKLPTGAPTSPILTNIRALA